MLLIILPIKKVRYTTGGFRGGARGHAPPQDARGDEVSPEHI